MLTCRAHVTTHVPVKTRCETRKALKHSRYIRSTLLVNPVLRQVKPVKVDQVERRLLDPAATMDNFTSGKRLFELEPT